MKILSDVDGVVLDYANPCIEWAERYYGWKRAISGENWKGFDDLFRRPRDEINKMINIFSCTYQYGRLPPYRDAKKTIDKIFQTHGVQFDFITAASGVHPADVLRMGNLQMHFGNAVSRIVYEKEKRKALSFYEGSGYIFVDDHPKNLEDAAGLGLDLLLMDNPSNRDFEHPEVRRVSSWEEIYDSYFR